MAEQTGATNGFAAINGARLFYETAGAGHPLILLHEGIANLHFWDDQWEPLAREYHVVRYDLRGFGKSVAPPGPFNMRDDLSQLMRFLGIPHAYLMGASIGGGIIVDFALEHSEMVDALIPVVPGLSGTGEPSEEDLRAWGLWELGGALMAAQQAGDHDRADELSLRLWVDGAKRTPDQVDADVRDRVRRMLRDNRGADCAEATPIRLDPPAVGRLGEIRAPTLVIVGDGDVPDVIANGEIIAREVPGARLAVMHGVAHVPNMEKPEEFNRIVLDFLGSLEPGT